MAKKEFSLLNMVLTMFIITLAASTALGYIYRITKEPIEEAKRQKKIAAIRKVVPDFNNNPDEEKYEMEVDGGVLTFYPAKNDSNLVGVAVETFTKKGFSGIIKLMVGLLPDGTLSRIEVLEHRETPGLGDKMQSSKSDFHVQFEGKNPSVYKLSVIKDGGDVDAITASTISSRAYCDAVQRAYDSYIIGGKK